MAALSRRHELVSSAKVGPDFIDPSYHALATGSPPRNLDEWISGSDFIAALAAQAYSGSSLLIIEGVMGLFDGSTTNGPSASSASVADLTGSPVVLVVDCSNIGQSVRAVVSGFLNHVPRDHHYFVEPNEGPNPSYDQQRMATLTALTGYQNLDLFRLQAVAKPKIVGIVLNKVSNESHGRLLKEALADIGVPILGVLFRDDRFRWRDRHLGLVPVVEDPGAIKHSLDVLSSAIEEHLDLDLLVSLAQAAQPLPCREPPRASRVGNARVAVASGRAFSFAYTDNVEQLERAGAQILPFDPTRDETFPDDLDGIVVGGGFPETYLEEIGEKKLLGRALEHLYNCGIPVWAECGGMAWLAKSLEAVEMCGIIDTTVAMTNRLTLGYREGVLNTSSPIGTAGTRVRGHEFHYSQTDQPGDFLTLSSRNETVTSGFGSPNLAASYLHIHLGTRPDLAENFVRSCLSYKATRNKITG